MLFSIIINNRLRRMVNKNIALLLLSVSIWPLTLFALDAVPLHKQLKEGKKDESNRICERVCRDGKSTPTDKLICFFFLLDEPEQLTLKANCKEGEEKFGRRECEVYREGTDAIANAPNREGEIKAKQRMSSQLNQVLLTNLYASNNMKVNKRGRTGSNRPKLNSNKRPSSITGNDKLAKDTLRMAAIASEAYYVDNNFYMMCKNEACAENLPGFRLPEGVEIKIEPEGNSISGKAWHTEGSGKIYELDPATRKVKN